MKKIKLFLLISISIVVLLSSCTNTMTGTDDVTIDLSSVLSKDLTGNEWVKIWLVADGTNNFYDLGDEAGQEIGSDKAVTLTHIPIGPTYRVYLSIGTKDTSDIFTAEKTVSGLVNVTGGATTNVTLTAKAIQTSLYSDLTGIALGSVNYVDGTVYTVKADGSQIYYGDSTGMDNYAASNLGTDYKFRDIDEGLDNSVMVTMKATNGKALGKFVYANNLWFINETFSDELPVKMYGDDQNVIPSGTDTTTDLTSSFIYLDDGGTAADTADDLQLGISQMDGGIVLSIYGTSFNDGVPDFMPVDFSDVLESLDDTIDLSGEFFKGFAVAKASDTEVWMYIASKIGNFRLVVPISSSGINDSDYTGDANIMDMLDDFVLKHPDLKDRVVLNIANADNDSLFVGTDSGLYEIATAADVDNMTTLKEYAVGKRVELLACSSTYTACVTPLNLIVINNSTGKTATVAFNEGLPVTGLLNEGITGLDWSGATLYIAGDYGLASLDVNKLTFN